MFLLVLVLVLVLRLANCVSLDKLLNDAHLPSDLRKGIDSILQLLVGVRGGQLHPDPGLVARHDGEGEANDIHAFAEHLVGHVCGEARVAKHDGHDGVLARPHVEAERGELGAEEARVLFELVSESSGLGEHVDGGNGGTNDWRRECVAEQVRPRFLPKQADHVSSTGGVSSSASAESLAQCGVDDIYLTVHAA